MTEIIGIRVSTKYGIDIYSTCLINNYHLYQKVLDESNFNIRFNYTNETDYEEFDIRHLLDLMKIITKPNKVLDYDSDINSSVNHPIFSLIELNYEHKYNTKINEHSIYKKYNDITHKINQTKNHINIVAKSFDSISLNNLQDSNPHKIWEYIYDKLNNDDPRIIEPILFKKLEEIITIYNDVLNKQKERIRYKKREQEDERIKSDKLREEDEKRRENDRIKLERELAERKMRDDQERQRVEALRIQAERMKQEVDEKTRHEREEKLKLKREEALRLAQIKQQEMLLRKKNEIADNEIIESKVDPNDPKEKKRIDALKMAKQKQEEILKKLELEKQLKYKNELKMKKIQEYEKKKMDDEKKRVEDLERQNRELQLLLNSKNLSSVESKVDQPESEEPEPDVLDNLLKEKKIASNKRKKKSASNK